MSPDAIEARFRHHVSGLGLVLRFEVEITDAPSPDGSHKREMFLDDVAIKKEKIDANIRINVEQFIIRKVRGLFPLSIFFFLFLPFFPPSSDSLIPSFFPTCIHFYISACIFFFHLVLHTLLSFIHSFVHSFTTNPFIQYNP